MILIWRIQSTTYSNFKKNNKMAKLNPFQQVLKYYLDTRAKEDKLFAVIYAKESKSIVECEKFVISEAQKLKRTALTDEEVFGMAVHYYDEDDIKNIKSTNCKVVIASASAPSSKLSTEDKNKAQSNTVEQPKQEEIKQVKVKPSRKNVVADARQLSLFDI